MTTEELESAAVEGSMNLFRELSSTEELSFRKWARENYLPLTPISGVWHPVVQDECRLINIEAAANLRDLLGDNKGDA